MQTTKKRSSRESGRAEQGFTILELVVSVGIFSIVMGAVYSLLAVGTSDKFTTNQRTEIIQNGRIALNTLGVNVQNAGYNFDVAKIPDDSLTFLGLPADADSLEDRLFPVMAGDNLKNNTLSGQMTDVISFASIDDSWNIDANGNSKPMTIDDINGGNQIRLLGPDTTAIMNVGDMYIISDSSSDTIGWCTQIPGSTKADFANSDPLNINKPGSGGKLFSTQVPATIQKLRWVSYWVEPDGTFVRAVMGDPAILDGNGTPAATTVGYLAMPLATGVENFQVQYVIRKNNASLVVDDPGATDDSPNIIQVRLTLQLRSSDADSRNGQFNRATVTATYNARNIRSAR